MLVTRPTIAKTIVKGTILILIFSAFLDFYKVLSFLLFLAIVYTSLLLYAMWKRSNNYEFRDEEIVIRTPLYVKRIKYSEIDDAFVSVGFLAKRFHCGSVYLILKSGKVEVIKDVPNPDEVFELLRKKVT